MPLAIVLSLALSACATVAGNPTTTATLRPTPNSRSAPWAERESAIESADAATGASAWAGAQESDRESDADLAQQLTNPLADLLTIPIQVNFDQDFGPSDRGRRMQTNVQPVIPVDWNEDWLLITRTVLPLIRQQDVPPGSGTDWGLGDITLSLFASPREPTASGWIWGVGPAFLVPTATEDRFGNEKWGLGPTGVALTTRGPWTVGALGNHIWSVAGDDNRADVNRSFVQPFVAYTTPTAWTMSVQTESVYDWEASAWSIPANFAVSKLVRWGGIPVSLQAGLGYWLESPDSGPEGYRFRLQANLVLPKPK